MSDALRDRINELLARLDADLGFAEVLEIRAEAHRLQNEAAEHKLRAERESGRIWRELRQAGFTEGEVKSLTEGQGVLWLAGV